jgi:tetratricopeptide (TPR) repeat protein
MLAKLLLRLSAVALFLTALSIVASAQVITVTGKVTLRQADGKDVPVQGAIVKFYRTDIKQEFEVKTDKKGQYTHAGIPLVGTFNIAVSAPGARPDAIRGIRISQQTNNDFVLTPGDGSVLTADQVKARPSGGGSAMSGGGGSAPKLSEEDKKRAEEERKKVAEIEEKNKKIVESNEVVSRTFTAGNEALKANKLDEAIALYNEGLAARPDEVALLVNISEAKRRRGVDSFNAAIKASQSTDAAKKDWSEAAEHSKKALEILKGGTGDATDATGQANRAANLTAAIVTRALAMRFVATKVDPTQAPAALAAYQEMIAQEQDPAKKAKHRGEMLTTLLDSGNTDLAAEESRKVLAEDANNIDANRVLGLALFASGDKAKYQEAANYLQRFVDLAPDTDPLKTSAKESLEYLKTAENVKPESTKSKAPPRRRP